MLHRFVLVALLNAPREVMPKTFAEDDRNQWSFVQVLKGVLSERDEDNHNGVSQHPSSWNNIFCVIDVHCVMRIMIYHFDINVLGLSL